MILTLALLAAAVAQDRPQIPIGAADGRQDANRPAPTTIIAEPVALLFAGFDRDGDGRTTQAEMRDGLAATHGDADWSAGIGYIAYSDWAERFLGDRNGVPTAFEADRNGDNRVTGTELGDRVEAIFARLDTNKDGALARAELLTVRANAYGLPERRFRRR